MVTEYEIHEFRRTRRSTLIEREYSQSRQPQADDQREIRANGGQA